MFHLLRDSGVALHWIKVFSVGVIFHIKRLRTRFIQGGAKRICKLQFISDRPKKFQKIKHTLTPIAILEVGCDKSLTTTIIRMFPRYHHPYILWQSARIWYSRSWSTLWQKPHHHNWQTNWIIKGHRPIRVVIWTIYFYFYSISILLNIFLLYFYF